MALNMKTYKGYNRMPYCEPHYPKTVSTAIVDTPEMQRVKANTHLQSQVSLYSHQYKHGYINTKCLASISRRIRKDAWNKN